MLMEPHVFVVMPFGTKEAIAAVLPDDNKPAKGAIIINFNDVYNLLIAPALIKAGCQPFRADEEKGASDIRTDMFFELVTADVIVADISILNPNVFYELGVRHGIRPRGVLMIHGGWSKRPFDIAPDRTFNYEGKIFGSRDEERDDKWKTQLATEVEKLSKTFKEALDADEQGIGSPVFNNLQGLKPADWSNIKTARAQYFGEVFVNWKARVEVAKLNGLPGDIMTLAEDAPTRFHRGKLLWEAARSLISLLRFNAAIKVLNDLIQLEPENIDALAQKGLVLGRLKKINEAKVHMAAVAQKFLGNPEAQGILGRVYKDMWRLEWDKENSSLPVRQQDAIMSSATAVSAIRSYDIAQRQHLDSYYNGINVIALSKVLEHLKAATGIKPVNHKIADIDDLIVVVRMAANICLASADQQNNNVDITWASATLGELELVAGDAGSANEYYMRAANTPDVTYFQIDSMLAQVRIFERLGFREKEVSNVVNILENKLGRLKNPQSRFNNIVLCSGHLTDKPGRETPRFPKEKEEKVGNCIRQQLDKWSISSGDLAICGGARGADILFAEACVARKAEVWLFISLEEGEFLEKSVRLADSNWEDRYFALRNNPNVKTFMQNERLQSPPKGTSLFARANLWMINTAEAEAKSSDKLHGVLVWDEQPIGDGPGGTSDFAAKVKRLGGRLAIINPVKL